MSNASWSAGLILLASRLSLGLYLCLAGVGKITGGLSKWMDGYQHMVPPWLPGWFATPYGHAVPFLEVIVGAALAVGLWGRLSAFATALLITSFTIAQIAASGSIKAGAGPFNPNFIFICLALLLAMGGPGRLSLDAVIFGWKSKAVMKKPAPAA